MNYVDIALEIDRKNLVVESAWAYELAIREVMAPLVIFLNLVALYFECNDTGFSASHHLEKSFTDATFQRAHEVLEIAEAKHGPNAEIDYWRLHFRERVLGEEIADADYIALANRGESMMPYLALFANSEGRLCTSEVLDLMSQAEMEETARFRYVRSFRTWVREPS